MTRPLMDWSDPRTPRQSRSAQQAAFDCPPARVGGGFAASRPSFEHLTGEVLWRTYPTGHLWLTIEQAEAVLALVAEEWTRARMSGGGPCGAVSMSEELTTAINAASRWRRASQPLNIGANL